jgi:[protein-PII] uridylyltransferase
VATLPEPSPPSATGPRALADLRSRLRDGDRGLAQRFLLGEDARVIVRARAALVDDVLTRLHERLLADSGVALIAVGGYGRGELYPHSDVDLLLLTPPARDAALDARLGTFVAALWDVGVTPALAVRSLDECLSAAADLETATALFEARSVIGAAEAVPVLLGALAPLWPAAGFLAAKRAEQTARHARAEDTAYRLEPDVKQGPGGLRDLHTIGWVAARVHGSADLAVLEAAGLLTTGERAALDAAHALLARVRYALHLAAGRREDRLLFDLQLRLARQFEHADTTGTRAVEAFMQAYYRAVNELGRVNELLLDALAERLDPAPAPVTPLAADPRFVVRGRALEAADPDLFRREPSALLEVFLRLQQHPGLTGLGPATLRLIHRDRGLIDAAFRAVPRHRQAFMDILRQPTGVTHELRRMNRHGVLGRYLPAFGAVVGRMQFDLFHAYTVDEHTLFVVANLRRFALPRCDHEFPLCSRLMQGLARPELAYLAGLFHDIAKGRGGDHSELGAREAAVFCTDHGLDAADAALVAWLVEHHLVLSVTAQKRDIADPAVIAEFARLVGDPLRLDLLYLLTVADVRGTNPRLWNSWKARLFEDLYRRTREALVRGPEHALDVSAIVRANRDAALELLAREGIEAVLAERVWQDLDDEYFLRHAPAEIAWHTPLLAAHLPREPVLLRVGAIPGVAGTAILVVADAATAGFARVTGVLDRLGLSVLDARLVLTRAGRSVQTYMVLTDDGAAVEPARHQDIERRAWLALTRDPARVAGTRRRSPRQARLFAVPTSIAFRDDLQHGRTLLELTAADRPGLLSEVGRVFEANGLRLCAAKVSTVGERAEDVFYLTDAEGRALADPVRRTVLAERLHAALAVPR